MADEQGKKEVSAEILAILRQRALFAEGELHAFLFARATEGDQLLIDVEIQESGAAADHLTSHLKKVAPDNMNSPDYQRGYESGLKQAAQLVQDMPTRKVPALSRQAFTNSGREDAFHFALEKQGDILQLQTEIERAEGIISRELARHPHGAMTSGASPRLYQDGYLSGLREAIIIVTHSSAS